MIANLTDIELLTRWYKTREKVYLFELFDRNKGTSSDKFQALLLSQTLTDQGIKSAVKSYNQLYND